MAGEPFFSVILPTHNRREMSRRAIDSVIGQTFLTWELVVVDDGSTDGPRASRPDRPNFPSS